MLGFHSVEAGEFANLRLRKRPTFHSTSVAPPPKLSPWILHQTSAKAHQAPPSIQSIRSKASPPAKLADVPHRNYNRAMSFLSLQPPPPPHISAPLMDEMWQVTQLQHEHTKLVSLVASLWDTFVQSQMGQKKISANVASSDVNGVDELQTRINRAEREIADLRQQQLLLATEKQDETAELSNILSELTSLKQRLAKALSSATEQLTTMEQASVPTQIQKDIAQLVVESNWMYATIISHNPLHYFASPSRSDQPVGSFSPGERILVFAKPLQTTSEGEWMQTRIGSDPDKRFWVQTVDLPSRRATLGHFDVCYRTNK